MILFGCRRSMAAGTGRLLCDWMTGRKPDIDTEGLAIERYGGLS